MFEITKGVIDTAKKIVIYGPEGIGKTTFASKFPKPLFIDTEGSTKHLNVARLPNPSSWQMLIQEINHVKNNPDICSTLVIDTADWAEQLCLESIIATNGNKRIKSIEDFGYGKGYVLLMEEFGRMLNLLNDVIERGVNVVLTAHAMMRKFEQPDELGAYDRWELKLQKKTAPLVKEWADMLLFANYKTYVINVDNQGAAKGKNKAQGGERVMYTSHHPAWDAKNRFNLPDEVPFKYESIKEIVESFVKKTAEERVVEMFGKENVEIIEDEEPKEIKLETPTTPEDDYPIMNEDSRGLPQALLDLMQANNVTPKELKYIVAKRGYYPQDTEFENYDPQFIEGVLIGAWEQVLEMIKFERDLPF